MREQFMRIMPMGLPLLTGLAMVISFSEPADAARAIARFHVGIRIVSIAPDRADRAYGVKSPLAEGANAPRRIVPLPRQRPRSRPESAPLARPKRR